MQTGTFPTDRAFLTRPTGAWGSLLEGVSDGVFTYLAHISGNVPIRALARAKGCHASTVLRQIRRVEHRRDDPLIDEALETATRSLFNLRHGPVTTEELAEMVAQVAHHQDESSEYVNREARRILRRLCEKDAFLAVAPDMDKAIVMRETVPGRHARIAVMDRTVAHQFALREWIGCESAGRVARYAITALGRSSLKRLLEEDRARRSDQTGFAEMSSPFRAQHQEYAERVVPAPDGSGQTVVRLNLAESPLSVLGRKKDRNGAPYLTADLIEAGERFREEFERAQMGPRVTQNWERFLTTQDSGAAGAGCGPADGPSGARRNLTGALNALGPGLSDVALRVCCFLEGLEAAERRLGWSARSGKVVLKIALQRLAQHYRIQPGRG